VAIKKGTGSHERVGFIYTLLCSPGINNYN
jgi:hypothetical protein